ncbi:MAG: MFS transporter, partial [Deltaproteobacteria bacterium]|nr:MFS transporter [Deltaproteobacteria bacterium]
VIIFIPALPIPLLTGLLLLAGLASGGMIIGFAFVKESVPSDLGGTASGILNMGVMAGPMIMQPAVGWILDLKWQGELLNGIKIYSFDAYRCGFSLMLTWAILSGVLIFFTKETHCQQTN